MSGSADPVFVTLTEDGAALARRLSALLPGSQVHGLDNRVSQADRKFADTLGHIRELYGAGFPLIGLFSTAIMIRALDGSLREKTQAPPVLCMAEDGSAIVPLLGGHNGANDLARLIGDHLGRAPAITTAGDARLGAALDDPPTGWGVSNRAAAKHIMSALLAGDPVTLGRNVPDTIDTGWLTEGNTGFCEDASPVAVHLTEAAGPAAERHLYLHPKTLVVGVGCERDVAIEEVADLVAAGLAETGLAPEAVACLATIDLKEDEAAIRALAAGRDLPLTLFSAAELEQETPRLANPSDTVFAAVGCHGVAEAAALAAAGPGATLALPKIKSKRATMAIARSTAIVDPDRRGRAPGLLTIVGIGPGQDSWRAPAATDAIARATDLVGYGLYIDLLGDLARGKTVHAYALGEERDRCADALSLAASGKRVALISSGDAGIYAMASLVYELVDMGDDPGWRRLAIETVPGISALQALAARAGAPLGHDFCAISLSDLLTPWPVIENRLRAAAAGDFVVALYNPVSKRRTEQLMIARDILLQARPPDTPVLLGRNLGRPGEQVEIIVLRDLTSEQVDMLTTVMVGSTTTRRLTSGGKPRAYTPRGYRNKGTDP